MSELQKNTTTFDYEKTISNALVTIREERERQIVIKRFGLDGNKQTLEQIGKSLHITRERVRQLEKIAINKLKDSAKNNKIVDLASAEKHIITKLSEHGRIAKIEEITEKLTGGTNPKDCSVITFISEISPNLVMIDESLRFYRSIAIGLYGTEKQYKEKIETIVSAIKKNDRPLTTTELHEQLDFEHPLYVKAYASISKDLSNLNDEWGLVSWPIVNPKNIRDKIYLILSENKRPLHFNKIAKSIQDKSEHKVTTQAVHNELIKDSRFVLIGRGIYALSSWGYSQGTVAETIEDVLKKAGEPLHRNEIVKRVLKCRQVKETTILINLQSRPQFKRVSTAVYTLASQEPLKK